MTGEADLRKPSVTKPRSRWRNFPLPEVFVVVLVVGVTLHLVLPLRIFAAVWTGHIVGWPALVAGLAIVAWSVFATAHLDIDKPAEIVTSGPYRFSRNPMYLSWALTSSGIGLVMNSGWVIMLVPAALLFLHLFIIPREERSLEKRFGQTYSAYKKRIRRWL